MQNSLFFMRVTFICNVCLLLTWLTKYASFLPEGFISSTVIVLGIGLSLILNILLHIVLLVLLVMRKPVWQYFPRWLIIVNFLFLIAQLILFLK